ncbi:MAG: RNA polymerase subunit sigma [Phyllobacteriaceae bacterium]|nr:RNA polymerase subunit sigma [Phyllobacteriaceae bacterium]MBA91709.1 RNA polymerase subunit sigma [Phyllobacteriaceae bacterium]
MPREEAEVIKLIPALRAFARSFYYDPNDADDLVQETLTKAIAKIHQFTPGTSMKSWLFTIMRNTFYTRIRIQKREAPGAGDCVSLKAAVDATQEWNVKGQELSAALHRLPAPQREILVLIGVMGTSYEEAADMLGCAMGTVKSRLNRARLRLLRELGEETPASSVEHDEDFTVRSIQDR